MRIDSHQHFWRYSPDEYGWLDNSMAKLRRDFLPLHLKPELDVAGFDACIAVQARQTVEETRWLLELAEVSPYIVGVIGWVDLQAHNVPAQLQQFAASPKLLGVRHIVQSEPDERFLMGSRFLQGIAALEEFGLTYDILIYPKHLPVAAELVSRFPRQHFVLDHLAKPLIKKQEMEPWKSDLQQLARFPNVYCKLSGLVTEADWQSWKPEHMFPYLEVAMSCFGPERLIIGSDWPVCTVAASYSQTMNVVSEFTSRYPETIREGILGRNAARLWRLRA